MRWSEKLLEQMLDVLVVVLLVALFAFGAALVAGLLGAFAKGVSAQALPPTCDVGLGPNPTAECVEVLEACAGVTTFSSEDLAATARVWRLARPKRARRADTAADLAAVKPDLDKLARCVLDALEGVLYVNDSRVTTLKLTKRARGKPGVTIVAWPEEPEA